MQSYTITLPQNAISFFSVQRVIFSQLHCKRLDSWSVSSLITKCSVCARQGNLCIFTTSALNDSSIPLSSASSSSSFSSSSFIPLISRFSHSCHHRSMLLSSMPPLASSFSVLVSLFVKRR